MAALAPQCEPAVRPTIKDRAMSGELRDLLGTVRDDQPADCLIGESRTRHQRILQMQCRIVIRTEGSCNAPLRLIRIAVPKRIAYHKQHMAASTRCRPGCLQPRNTRANDQKLCTLLKAQGIALSRRTVMKYREQLGYDSSVKRKRY